MHLSADSSGVPPGAASGDSIGSYLDVASDRWFVIARPAAQRDLWLAYLDGARETYRRHEVESALDYDIVRDGASSAVFIAAVELSGRVVGGLRVQGPYTCVDQAYAVREWAGRPGAAELRSHIARRLSGGVIEVKAVWVDPFAIRHGELTAALARTFVHLLTLMGVRYALCTAAGHAVPRWQSVGGVIATDVAAVAYPDDRYQTSLMWWDRQRVFDTIASDQIPMILLESACLFGAPPATTCAPSVA